MKTKSLLFFLFTLIFAGPFDSHAQIARPSDWNNIIQRRWYQGTVYGKPVFAYLDPANQECGYFFVADKSLPDIYELVTKKKKNGTRSVTFRMQGKKIKAKFQGTVQPDTIGGLFKSNRRNARLLGIPPLMPVYMVPEKSVTQPALNSRYISPVFKNVDVTENINFGAATGYYSTMPLGNDSVYNYQQILLDAMKSMYVNPTKQALLHILNNDPVSLALTDLQSLYLDLYQPYRDTLKTRPLLVLLHGGAFILGDKATATVKELSLDFAMKGYVVASMNYRMGFNPASKSSLERSAYRAVQDARAALRFLSLNAASYGIDTGCVLLGGSSAGAITALNVAFMKDEERPESSEGNIWLLQKDLGKLDESTNNCQSTYKITAVANLWGAVNDTSIIDREEQIPVLSFHGDADKIVPFGYNYPFTDMDTSMTSNIVSKLFGSWYINQRLKNLGIYSELVIFPGAGHEPQYEKDSYSRIMNLISTRVTDFYFKSLFYFPEIKGPGRVAVNTPPTTYSLPGHEELSYYWQVSGGKIIPGSLKNQVRVAWLSEEAGNISLVMVHKNQASLELEMPVTLPEGILNFYPVSKKTIRK